MSPNYSLNSQVNNQNQAGIYQQQNFGLFKHAAKIEQLKFWNKNSASGGGQGDIWPL